VGSTSRSDENPHESIPGTLGGLLYADRSKARIREEDWAELIRAIAAQDQRALQALYTRAHPVAFTLILRITQSRETAEELVVDLFHDVWRRAPQYDPAGGTVLGWIMNQARSRAIDRMRFEQRKKRVAPRPEVSEVSSEPLTAQSSHEVLEIQEQGRLLRGALCALSSGEREAIENAFFSDLTYAEVAVRLKQPVGTVKTRIRSGLAKLRQALLSQVEPP
jgi:RNA polymerase sigma-70 factor, ECF subfamily